MARRFEMDFSVLFHGNRLGHQLRGRRWLLGDRALRISQDLLPFQKVRRGRLLAEFVWRLALRRDGVAFGGGADAGCDIGQRHGTRRCFLCGRGASRIGGNETRVRLRRGIGELHAGIGLIDRQLNLGAVIVFVIITVNRRQRSGKCPARARLIAFDDLADRRQDFFHGRFTRYAWLSHIYPRYSQTTTGLRGVGIRITQTVG
jgi:hypothetical protein